MTADDATDDTLPIREVATRTGVSVHTLRYYERVGLMAPIGRATSGYRRYREADIEWVIVLRCLRATGMPIAGMRRFAEAVQRGEETVPERLALLEAHRRDVDTHLRTIANAMVVLDEKIARYRTMTTA